MPPGTQAAGRTSIPGVFWSQYNGKDWTVTAYLQTNHGGLQLKIARDSATAASIRRALEKLVDVPVAELRAKAANGQLNGSYFDSLAFHHTQYVAAALIHHAQYDQSSVLLRGIFANVAEVQIERHYDPPCVPRSLGDLPVRMQPLACWRSGFQRTKIS